MPSSAEALAGKLRIDDLEPQGRRVLLRADLNLPVQDGVVTDMTRVIAMLPTLRALLGAGAAVLIMIRHVGPPGDNTAGHKLGAASWGKSTGTTPPALHPEGR